MRTHLDSPDSPRLACSPAAFAGRVERTLAPGTVHLHTHFHGAVVRRLGRPAPATDGVPPVVRGPWQPMPRRLASWERETRRYLCVKIVHAWTVRRPQSRHRQLQPELGVTVCFVTVAHWLDTMCQLLSDGRQAPGGQRAPAYVRLVNDPQSREHLPPVVEALFGDDTAASAGAVPALCDCVSERLLLHITGQPMARLGELRDELRRAGQADPTRALVAAYHDLRWRIAHHAGPAAVMRSLAGPMPGGGAEQWLAALPPGARAAAEHRAAAWAVQVHTAWAARQPLFVQALRRRRGESAPWAGFGPRTVDWARGLVGPGALVWLVPRWSAGQLAFAHLKECAPQRHWARHGAEPPCAAALFVAPPPAEPQRDSALVLVPAGLWRELMLAWLVAVAGSSRLELDMTTEPQPAGWWAPLVARALHAGTWPERRLAVHLAGLLTVRRPIDALAAAEPSDLPAAVRQAAMTRWWTEARWLPLLHRLFGGGGPSALSVRQRAQLVSALSDGAAHLDIEALLTVGELDRSATSRPRGLPVELVPIVNVQQLVHGVGYPMRVHTQVLRAVRALLRSASGQRLRARDDGYTHLLRTLEQPPLAPLLDGTASAESVHLQLGPSRRTPLQPVAHAPGDEPDPLDAWFPRDMAALLRLCSEPETPGWLVQDVIATTVVRRSTRFQPRLFSGDRRRSQRGWLPPPVDTPVGDRQEPSLAGRCGCHLFANAIGRLGALPLRRTVQQLCRRDSGICDVCEPVAVRWPASVRWPAGGQWDGEAHYARWATVHDPDAKADAASPAAQAAQAAWRQWLERAPVCVPGYRKPRSNMAAIDADAVLCYRDDGGTMQAVRGHEAWPVMANHVMAPAPQFGSVSGLVWDVAMSRINPALMRVAPDLDGE
jgi:hypothetical protein